MVLMKVSWINTRRLFWNCQRSAGVKSQRGRTYGSNIYLDVVIEMNPDLSVYESHAITEEVERLLKEQFGVFDIDVHVGAKFYP